MASGSLEELTASFRKKDGTIIKLRKGGEEVASELRKIPGVEKLTRENNEFKIEWSQGKDLRDVITRFVVEKELGLVEMRPIAMNIEELYLRIVSGGEER